MTETRVYTREQTAKACLCFMLYGFLCGLVTATCLTVIVTHG